jgi:hypothetical protein
VDFDRALEPPVLSVDDPLEQRGHEVDELDVGGDRKEGHVQPVRLAHHLGRQLAEVGQGPNNKAGAPGIGDPADQADLGRDVVFDREPTREHEVARPRLNLGRLHEPHPLDWAIEPLGAGDELGVRQSRVHGVADGRAGLNLGFSGLLGRHGSRL